MTRDAEAARKKAVAMNAALTSLTESWKQPNAPTVPDAAKKAADDLAARAKTVAGMFEAPGGGRGGRGGGGGGAGAPPAYVPPPVTQKIGRLLSAIDNFSGVPTSRQLADIEEASVQLQKDLAELNKLWDEVPKLNKTLADAGVPYFTIDVNNTRPAGRGGN